MVNGEWRIGLFAKHDIPQGTELTFDYNFERFGSKKQKCYCNTATCRGYLGAKPKHLEAELKKKNGKRKPAAAVGRVKRTKSALSGDLTLLEQNWGLPPPPKKARGNFTVDHMQHVTTLLTPPESETSYPRQLIVSRLFLRRNVNLIRKVYSQYFKTCVAQALSGKTKKNKSPSIKSPTIPSSTPPPPLLSPIPAPVDSQMPDTSSPGSVEDNSIAPTNATGPQPPDSLQVKREVPLPISARRRKRKIQIRHSPKILDVLKKLGKVSKFTPGDFIKTLDRVLVDVPVKTEEENSNKE